MFNWLTTIFTGEDQTARGEQLDAKLAAINNAQYGPGGSVYNLVEQQSGTDAADLNWQTVQNHLNAQRADTASFESQVAGGFWDGLKQGAANVGSFLKNPFMGIPVAWWFIGAISLFLWMGGLDLIKGILKKK